MEDTRFVDLKVKVGFPYLYCHQGDCEHLVIITDIRSKQVLSHRSVPTRASELVSPHYEQTEILDLTDYLRSCHKSMTSSTFTLSGRSRRWFCHETWILKDTVLVTRSDIKPSLVSLNCVSRDLAANLVPRIAEKKKGRGISSCSGNARRSCSSCHERLVFFTGWPTGATAWIRNCIRSSHTSTGSPRRSAASATSSSEGAFWVFPVEARDQMRTLNPLFSPRWFTTGDRLAPSDPCLFCDKCFRMLHYDDQGNKLGEFQAFPFVDRGAFN